MTKKQKEPADDAAAWRQLASRVAQLEADVSQLRSVTANQIKVIVDMLRPQGRSGPIEQQGYLAGQVHRRDGTVYGRVAARGTPNADDPTGSLPPTEKR